MLGFLFALGCRIFSRFYGLSVQGIGNVYILEAMGASIGGLILNFLLIRILNPFQIALFIASINLLAALLLQISQPGAKSLKIILAFLLLFVAALMTAFYIWRQIIMVFHGEPRTKAANSLLSRSAGVAAGCSRVR